MATHSRPASSAARVRVELQTRGDGHQQARLRFSDPDSQLCVPVPGQGDLPAGESGWRNALVSTLPSSEQLVESLATADSGPLLEAYEAADRTAWVRHLRDFQAALVEFDDTVVTVLTNFQWHRDARPWTADLEVLLRTGPHARHLPCDLFVVATPAPAGRWLEAFWSLPGARDVVQLAGHPNDSSETLTTALALWSRTGGALPIVDAFTTARHATHPYPA